MFIDSEGRKWFKGNLHTHTNRSDGRVSPDESIAIYRADGYDFMAVTDHWKAGEGEVRDGFLILSGAEYDFGRNPREGIFHIVGIGCETEPDITRADNPQSAIDKIHAHGGIANLAHPCWSMNTVDQVMPLEGIDFTEIYNSVSTLPRNCRPYSGDVVDKLATRGKILKLAATDDTHWYAEEMCLSFIYVNAEENTRESILEAIKAGRFYASQGPVLDVRRDGKDISVFTREEDNINAVIYFTDSVWTPHRSDTGENITESHFTLTGNETFVRVEVKSSDGKYAWGQFIKA